ncbi:phenylacetate-CoA ligase [Caenispirillum bisanense]|uniref:Phenylacetate-coenzyme A ligase n=2 Tax=Caenispirillum bisanense TaxID=414052 RepID=A0A286G121_9PROT|nr:phenylacetate-CoA ligase [Caenispirillum bisanense]
MTEGNPSMNMLKTSMAKMDLTKRPAEHELDPIEICSRDELTAIQTRRMKWSVRHAYENVEHYRKKCDDKGIHPRDFKELADLRHFPTTSKADLRDTYPYGMFAVPMDEVVRIHASSGTTGKPTVVGYTASDIQMWSRVMARSIRAAGGRRNMKVHISYGYGLFTGGLGAHYGAEALGCTVIPMSGGQTEKQVALIRDFQPEIIMVTPSYMLVMADEMERQGMNPRDCSLKIGIFGAEPWTNDMRLEIEERLGIDAIDIYGLSEVIGPGVGIECIESKDGLTIWEDHFYPEIINPETGEPVPDGEIGELVFTSLTKEAMPVIRYRTRDLTRLLPGTARTMRRIEKITGRSDDMLIIRGVNVFPTQIEELILKDSRLAPHYQLVVSRQGHLDALKVRVEMRTPDMPRAACEAAGKELAHHIKSFIGVSAVVDVEPHGAIERSQGKAKRIIDLRKEA